MGGDVLMTAVERILAMRGCGYSAKETDKVVLAPHDRELFRQGEDSRCHGGYRRVTVRT